MNYSGVDWQRYYMQIFDDKSGKTTFPVKVKGAYMKSRFAASIRQYLERHGMVDDYEVESVRGRDLVIVRKVSV